MARRKIDVILFNIEEKDGLSFQIRPIPWTLKKVRLPDGDAIEWRFKNQTNLKRTVELDGFTKTHKKQKDNSLRHRIPDERVTPIAFDPPTSPDVEPWAEATISGRVMRNPVNNGYVYKYDIKVAPGYVLDPELEITDPGTLIVARLGWLLIGVAGATLVGIAAKQFAQLGRAESRRRSERIE